MIKEKEDNEVVIVNEVWWIKEILFLCLTLENSGSHHLGVAFKVRPPTLTYLPTAFPPGRGSCLITSDRTPGPNKL